MSHFKSAAAIPALLFGLLGCQVGPTEIPLFHPGDSDPTSAIDPGVDAPADATLIGSPIKVWRSPDLPPELAGLVEELLDSRPEDFSAAGDLLDSDVQLVEGGDLTVAERIYALAAPFPAIQDSAELSDLQAIWSGSQVGPPIFTAGTTRLALRDVLGDASPDAVTLGLEQELLDLAWGSRPSLALLPFENLEPRWKVLQVDGQSPIRSDFDSGSYPLRVIYGLTGDPNAVDELVRAINWPGTNRDPERITTLLMTGVSALVRGTADRMVTYGATYPGLEVRPWLVNADITHISHEVSFSGDCPPPDPFASSLRFCADPEHILLFDDVGVDLIELTGNHLLDWGAQAFLDTLDLYASRDWLVYGGGRDETRAAKAVTLEHNGNRLAFMGCNAAGPAANWAGPASPGAARCTDEQLEELRSLRAQGYLTVFSYQWPESKSLFPLPNQVQAFRSTADAGAVIVSGSQAHRPQTMEFYAEGFIHYGLGNLFFDQMQTLGNRQEFLDRYVLYDGRLLSIELLTALLEDFSQPRPMTADERSVLLGEVFAASGW